MGKNSGIEWCDHTWNPWMGCLKVSTGCANCYMYAEFKRYGRKEPNVVQRSKTTFKDPLKWRGPATVFTCSWSDWFHAGADAWRDEAWEIIRRTPELTYLILTKRIEWAVDRLPADWGEGWPNVWIGASVEDQEAANRRLPALVAFPAQHRFISCEPLVGPVDLEAATPADDWAMRIVGDIETRMGKLPTHWDSFRPHLAKTISFEGHIEWVIAGGESGTNARSCHPDWVRRLRKTCIDTMTPFFFKGWGEAMPLVGDGEVEWVRLGRHRTGRVLDGREWLGFPESLRRAAA